MDRNAWLKQTRQETAERIDSVWAPLYGEKWSLYPNATHQQFVQRFLSLLPNNSLILDAACGAGRYMPMLLEQGHAVIGMDQSQGMLAHVKEKFPAVPVEKIGLQEMSYQDMFDGAICMDAMESVFHEDWPLILNNFHRALKPQGHLYFTVEMADEDEVRKAFIRAQQAGLPVVYGEYPDETVYHYYPSLQQVGEWIRQAGFDPLQEGDGDGYHHFILQKVVPGAALQPGIKGSNSAQPHPH